MRYLITGTAGFIGFHVAQRLAGNGNDVLGIDSMNSYYDVQLKRKRHAVLSQSAGFRSLVV